MYSRTACWARGLIALASVIAMVVAHAMALPGCAPRRAKTQQAPPPPEVAIVVVEHRTIPIEYEFVGMTQASRRVEIRSRVTGFLLRRFFEEGKAIQAGEPLFEIDSSPFEADLEVTRSRLAQAEAAERLAQLNLTRFTEAIKAKAANQSELDQIQSQFDEARAAVRLAKAQVRNAELDLSYTDIASPVTGTIGRALVDEGTYLDAGPSLLAIATQTDPMYVTFGISERDWLQWRSDSTTGVIVGNAAYPDIVENPPSRLTLLDGTMYPSIGTFNFFDSTVNPETGTATARVEFVNAEQMLKPGQFVKVVIFGWERPNSIVIPPRAVIQNPAGAIVFVVNAEDVVEVRPVTLGQWTNDGWLILSGLKPGERVVADGQVRAQPGANVTTVAYVPPPKPDQAGTKGALPTKPPGATPAAPGASPTSTRPPASAPGAGDKEER